MNLLRRIKNIYKLSEYKPERATATEVSMGIPSINLVRDIKPKPHPATIVQDDPLDVFPNDKAD